MRRYIMLLAFVPIAGFATTEFFRPLTKETFNGTWEAVMPIDATTVAGVYRMEISAISESCLVGVFVSSGDPPFVKFSFRLVSSTFSSDSIKLLFEGSYQDKSVKVIFEGSGTSNGDEGQFHGKFRHEDGQPFESLQEVYFRKGSWTRNLQIASAKSEDEIRMLQGKRE